MVAVVGRRESREGDLDLDLSETDLQGARFGEADLNRVILRRANLKGAHLVKAHLEGAKLDGAYFDAETTSWPAGLSRKDLEKRGVRFDI